MITKKEDLINTYIVNDHGELRDLYISALGRFGVDTCESDEHFLIYEPDDYPHMDTASFGWNNYNNSRRLTISDLKPRTRTKYERVTESIFDLRDEFERGELYCKHEHAREFTQVINTQTLAQALHGGYCFRKVEKEIDWREEVSNFVDDKYSYITIHENGAADALLAASSNINFLELCRVALRANGELD